MVASTSFGQFQPLVTAAAQLQYYPKWVTVAPNVQQNEVSSDLAPLGSKVVDNVIVVAALVPYGETSNAGIRQFQQELAAAKAKGVANAGAGLVDEFAARCVALGSYLCKRRQAHLRTDHGRFYDHRLGPHQGTQHVRPHAGVDAQHRWSQEVPAGPNPDLYAAHITNGDKVTLLSTKTISLAHFPFSETNG